MGNQWAPKRAPSASLPQPGTGEDSSEGSIMGRRGEGRELMAVDRKMGYLLV